MKHSFYKELTISSDQLLIPRTTYQRELNEKRVHRIAAQFDERIANEPKVSCRRAAASLGRSDGSALAMAETAVSAGLIAPVRISCLMPGRASSAASTPWAPI